MMAAGVGFGTEISEEVDGPSTSIGRGVSIQVDDGSNLL